MERFRIEARPDWREKVEALGFVFHSLDEEPYWDETAYYSFTSAEIDRIEEATNTLHELCIEAAGCVVDDNRFGELGIPESAVPLIRAAWEQDPPSVYGRFDLAYDGRSEPKLLEYNADTPTSLLEAAVIQWDWLEGLFPDADQFNSIHEALIETWQGLSACFADTVVYFASLDNVEDKVTALYMMDTALQAGLAVDHVNVEDIGWDDQRRQFVNLDGKPLWNVFKLYPWEWLISDEFWPHAVELYEQMTWVEPIWKMLLSNKGILPILWELHPGHQNLLEAHFDEPARMPEYVKKPLLSREGANITMKTRSRTAETGGAYGEGRYIYQAAARIPDFDGNFPVIGSWVVGDAAHGMGIRESHTPITDNRSRFVPHLFR